jgi:hypothetical protein
MQLGWCRQPHLRLNRGLGAVKVAGLLFDGANYFRGRPRFLKSMPAASAAILSLLAFLRASLRPGPWGRPRASSSASLAHSSRSIVLTIDELD